MSWENRDYNRGGGGMGGFGGGGGSFGGMSGQSVATWLIIVNFGVFVLNGILGGAIRGSALAPVNWGNFNIPQAIYGGQIWRFLTYQFNHANFLHFFFNMIGLFFFGPMLERSWGPRRFLAFYLLCGSAGAGLAAAFSLLPALGVFGPNSELIGASGAVFGILVACAVLFPRQRVQLLFPPIPMTMRTMALVFLGISVASILAGSANAGGEAAHLGGAALGFLLATNPGLLGWSEGLSANTFKVKIVTQKKEKAARREVDSEAEIDRILAKVSEQGLQSLTAKEKKTLNRETERKRG